MRIGQRYDIEEKTLGPYAAKSRECKGRPWDITEDPVRLPWERDYHRILYSQAFRRLKHKTQVFFAPENDHITTRMDHSLEVTSISETICRGLELNVDLAEAIAIGHDLGHAPFGHTGERILDELCSANGIGGFCHELNSLRVIDMMKELHGERLSLTYEVRDGIVCHSGETYDRVIEPNKTKDITSIRYDIPRSEMPYTLEGCVVRYVDRVAYLAADVHDAITLGIIKEADVPKNVRKVLGRDTGEIVGKLTEDILSQSIQRECVMTSKNIFDCIEEFYKFSKESIYNSSYIKRQEPLAEHIVKSLYQCFTEVLIDTSSGFNKRARKKYGAKIYEILFDFVDSMEYPEDEKPERIAVDFVSGMTDGFAMSSFFNIFPMRTR